MPFGILIRNSNGDILIDGEHVHPILHATITRQVTSQGEFVESFPPTTRPVIVVTHPIGGSTRIFSIRRDSQGRYIGFIHISTPGQFEFRVYVA